ncbi:NAD(P)/FAD-dependent oxidoreductase [Acetobacter ghanensis]|uniref:NAD(P)/FAD-dependent oxidoreductase n=1 Tax=Acetobacter ghanensis TaxID=431306 RepID=UPI003D329A55
MFDVLVIGGGAAGLMAALTAGQRGRRVAVLEHGPEVGRKILISGGGRCNFTNQTMRADRFLSANRHFVKSAISRYQPSHFLDLLARHRIAWHEKKLGQLFCDNSAHDIVQMLLDECAAAHVRILTDVRVYGVEKSDVFRVQTSMGDLTARAVVLATGGLSIPKLGASRFTYEVARQFGLAIVPPEPALVPLTFSGESEEWVRSLAGLSLPVRVTCGKTSFEEALLFTHRGMSGPALLQISSYWSAGQPLFVDFLPGQDIAALLAKLKKEGCKAKGAGALARWLPQRLAHALVELGAPERTLAEWADRDIRLMAERVHRMELRPQGTEGFAKAEVTRGGVDTRGLSSQTMEARTVPGLYVVGEAVDVTGWLGGYNFHWAWASGHAAGEALGAA